MKKLLRRLLWWRKNPDPLLRSYLAAYNGHYWQQPGVRHFGQR